MGVLLQFQDVSGSTESCWRGCLLIRLHASREVNLMGLEYSLAEKLAKGPGQTLVESGCMPEHDWFACVAYQIRMVISGCTWGSVRPGYTGNTCTCQRGIGYRTVITV